MKHFKEGNICGHEKGGDNSSRWDGDNITSRKYYLKRGVLFLEIRSYYW